MIDVVAAIFEKYCLLYTMNLKDTNEWEQITLSSKTCTVLPLCVRKQQLGVGHVMNLETEKSQNNQQVCMEPIVGGLRSSS